MKIVSILNNNVVRAEINGREIVAVGKGLAFGHRPGDEIDEKLASKVFELATMPANPYFSQLLEEIPQEYWEFAIELTDLCERKLERKLKTGFYISLVDHIYIAVARARQNMVLPGLFALEAKRYYPDEYAAAEEVVERMEKRFSVKFDESEAAFITFHLIDSAVDINNSALDMLRIIDDVLKVVKENFTDLVDESSMYYDRFLTHLRFFAQRLYLNRDIDKNVDLHYNIFKSLADEFPKQYVCICDIHAMIKKEYNYEMSLDEQCYLMLHVIKVTTR